MRVLVVCLVACGSAQRAPSKEPPLEVRTYAPLAFATDAKAPQQAVILGTDDGGGSTLLPLPALTAGAELDGIRLTVGPGREATDYDGIAPLVAATVLDKNITDFTFSANSSAPDTSARVAAGFLAVITGARVDAKATVFGMLHADGTIGAVAGIAEQFTAALDAGKKRLGYPAGFARARELVALAKQHGAEAIEVGDVYQAYTLITGKRLPQPRPVAEADMMVLDPAIAKSLEDQYKKWQQQLATEWAAILTLESAGRLPRELASLRDAAKSSAEDAEQLHKRGMHGAAYARVVAAAVYATSANRIYEVLARVQAGKIADAVGSLDKLETFERATDDALTRIGALSPTTLGAHLQTVAMFSAALRAHLFARFAATPLAQAKTYLQSLAGKPGAELGSPPIADVVVTRVAPAIVYLARTNAELVRAELALTGDDDVSYTCARRAVGGLALRQEAAGSSAMPFVDHLLELYDKDARDALATREPDFLVTSTIRDDLSKLASRWANDSLATTLLQLAAADLVYASATRLLEKHGGDEGALAPAERAARAAARAAKVATGAIPVEAKLAYQLARAMAQDRTEAVAQYRLSSMLSQTAVMLARNAEH